MSTDFNFKLRAGLQQLGCSALSFSALAVPPITKHKLSQQTVSQLLAGTKEFDSRDDAEDFLGVIATMEYLQNKVVPRVPINWSNVLELKDILIAVHEQQKNEADPIVIQHPFLRLSRTNFFGGIRSNDTVIETINPERDGVAFKDLALAQKAIAKLKDIGVTAQFERLTAPRRRSTITTNLEQVGFKIDEAPPIEVVNEIVAA